MHATRRATLADAALIASHRRAMFAAMGAAAPDILDEMTRNFHLWLLPRLTDGRYMGWIAEDGGPAIASAGLLLLDWPPHPLHPAGSLRGYILNVFVDPEYRRGGLARALVECCLAEARMRNLQVVTLHASAEGRPLYESMGFRSNSEMQLVL